jgi:hypothetical protein
MAQTSLNPISHMHHTLSHAMFSHVNLEYTKGLIGWLHPVQPSPTDEGYSMFGWSESDEALSQAEGMQDSLPCQAKLLHGG